MQDLFEQIGITKEELIDRIVDKALGTAADYCQTGEESWADIPLSEVVDDKITKAIGNLVDKMKPFIQGRIETIMVSEVEKVFTMPFQPVNRWNEPKGELTTIRDMISKEAEDYWSTKVDENGKVSGQYNSAKEPRAVFFARKVMTEYYEKELVQEVKNMASELKNRIPETIAGEITKTVLKHLK
jgi:hypothetical protein